MSKTLISLLVILCLVVAGAGLWWFGVFDSLITTFMSGGVVEEPQEEVEQAPEQPKELTTGGDSSDQALEQDLEQLDTQFDAYNETSAELDSSLSDEPVEQDPNF